MRILQITNKVPWPPKDGGAIACLNLTRGFSLLGHQVTVLAMNTVKHRTRFQDIPENLRSAVDFRLVDINTSISAIKAVENLLFSNLPYNAERFISRKFEQALIQLLNEKKFDVIQLEGLYLCPYIPIIRQYSTALISYRAHNIEYEIWQRTALIATGWRRFYLKHLSRRIKRFEKNFLNSYDVLIPITTRDGEILNALGNTKEQHTSQTGIDLSLMVPKASKLEYPSLFHIGSLDWAPNQEGLIWFLNQCWPKILTKYPELKFYVAGRNAPEWFERRLYGKNIVYMGEVEDAYEFINSKAIMVAPVFSGSGMRIKIVEGMALGKPIVTTSIGTEGIATTTGENILIADEAPAFIAAIESLLEDRKLFDQIGKSAIDFVQKKFDNLALATELVEFYSKKIQSGQSTTPN